jgi:hypothetical protein
LSILGGIIGVFLSWAGLKAFIAAAPRNFPRLNEITLDSSVFGFTALIVVLTVVALGAGGDDVLRLIARQAATVISIGLVLGLAGSFALTRSSSPRSSD